MSAACTGVFPLTRVWVKLGWASRPLVVTEYISPQRLSVLLKSSEVDPYHAIATRPGSPAVFVGNVLVLRAQLSTWLGVLRGLPLALDVSLSVWVGGAAARRSGHRVSSVAGS